MPPIEAYLFVPSIDSHITLQLLVDTGADVTSIHPRDSMRLAGRDTASDRWQTIRQFPSETFGGAGRDLSYYGVPAVLGFREIDGRIDQLPIRVWIGEPSALIEEHESLLGRDVLAHYAMSFSQPHALVLERNR